jgi:hypothetical protein
VVGIGMRGRQNGVSGETFPAWWAGEESEPA